jgi:hypothetical protein
MLLVGFLGFTIPAVIFHALMPGRSTAGRSPSPTRREMQPKSVPAEGWDGEISGAVTRIAREAAATFRYAS